MEKGSGVSSSSGSTGGLSSSLKGRYLEFSTELFVGEAPLEPESDADMKLDPEDVEENDPAKDCEVSLSSILEVGQALDWFISLLLCSKVSSSKVTQFL